MGLIKLRDKDIRRARSERYRDKALDRRWGANDLLERWMQEAKGMGVRVVPKTSFFGMRLSKMSTTYYREIRLGTGYPDKRPEWKAVTMGHEMLHARQWRGYGRNKFRTRYLFWTRWRWAIEVQAYSESVRILVALGANDETLTEYIASRSDVLWNSYALKGLRRKDVYVYTHSILCDARVEAERRLAA